MVVKNRLSAKPSSAHRTGVSADKYLYPSGTTIRRAPNDSAIHHICTGDADQTALTSALAPIVFIAASQPNKSFLKRRVGAEQQFC